MFSKKTILTVIATISILFIARKALAFSTSNSESPYPTPEEIAKTSHLQESFDAIEDWSLISDEGTFATQSTLSLTDTASIQLSADDTTALMCRATTLDLSAYTGGELTFYAENVENIEYVSLYFATDANLTKPYGYVVIDATQIEEGWNTIPFATSQIYSENGFTQHSTATTIEVMLHTDGGEASIYLDALHMIDADKGNVMFTMDDASITQYSVAYPMMQAYGIPGNIAVIPSTVGTDGYMSKRQLRKVYEDGWDLMNHTNSHVDLTTLSKEEQKKEIEKGTQWLNNHGFTRASHCVVYPYGKSNEDTYEVMDALGIPFARSIEYGIETSPTTDKYQIKVINLTQDVTVDTAKKEIDTAIATGNTVIFLNHKFGDEDDPMYYSEEKFEEILQYTKEQIDSGHLQALTVSEWLALNQM